MVWAYLCGRIDSSEEGFNGVKVVFEAQGGKQPDWTFVPTTSNERKAHTTRPRRGTRASSETANLKAARWEAEALVNSQQSARVKELKNKNKK